MIVLAPRNAAAANKSFRQMAFQPRNAISSSPPQQSIPPCSSTGAGRTVLEQALKRLREEAEAAGNTPRFDRLKVFLEGETSGGDYPRLAAELNMRDRKSTRLNSSHPSLS